jgi:hypothetical protein
MKKRIVRTATLSLAVLFAAASMSFAQPPSSMTTPAAAASDVAKPAAPAALSAAAASTTASSPVKTSAQPSDAEMMKQMMELAKTGENHKLLAGMVGTWTYTVKMWMNPSAPPTSSTGSAVIKAIMDGRYFVGDFTGKMQMPGADGKMKDMPFKGMSMDGYDNVKKKFVSTWCDSMGTGIMISEGTYDAASKTFAYAGEYEGMPGMKSKVRMTVKIVDKDHHNFEFYENRGAGEAKTMEINYTRKK